MRSIVSLAAVFIGVSLWVSCREKGPDEASRAAEMYYNYIIDGKYDEFVRSIAYSDSMTDEYRAQMVDLVAQYAAREKSGRGGLAAVRILRDTVAGDVASVFLEVVFGDSTREEVSLPMVKCGDVWKMQ